MTQIVSTIDFCRSHGFSFLPIPSGSKHPLEGWKRFQTSLPTEEEIQRWRSDTKPKNLFIITGKISNLVVVDLDKPKESEMSDDDWARAMIEEHQLPRTYSVRTGGGWLHLYYRYPVWYDVKNSVKGITHMDIRWEWGGVIAAWSLHATGNRYTVWDYNDGVLADFPRDLLMRNTQNSQVVQQVLHAKPSVTRGNQEGTRNDTTFRWLTKVAKEYEDDWVYEWLRERLGEYNSETNSPPLDEDELDRIYQSVTSYRANAAENKEETKLDRMIDIVSSNGRLVMDQIGDVYFVLVQNKTQRVMPLEGSEFKHWLQGEYYKAFRSIINASNLDGIKSLCVCQALSNSRKYTVDIRILKAGEAIHYDLNNKQLSCIKITKDWWVHSLENMGFFKRVKNTDEQVVPIEWWDINTIWQYINISDADTRLLVLCTLVSLFIPDIQHPILMIHGEKWSAKSTFLMMIKRIVDPSAKDLLGLPGDLSGLVHTFLNDYILMYDNISGISNDTSDLLCRAVSGWALSKRMLYTDSEDIIYKFKKCICLNGINLEANQPDLLQRSIIVELEPINLEARIPESTLWANFEQDRPAILWALFTVLSKAMAIYESLNDADYSFHRLADYNKWWEAICQALGYEKGKFTDLITANMKMHDDVATDSNVVASALREFMGWRSSWEWTAQDLRDHLYNISSSKGVWKYIPTTPQSFMKTLNRYKVNLENLGITFESKHSGNRTLTIKNSNLLSRSYQDLF